MKKLHFSLNDDDYIKNKRKHINTSVKNIKKACMFFALTIIFLVSNFIVNVNYSKAATIQPQDDQKVEYRATKINKTEKGNQLIVEIWIHNLNFKGIDLRLEYDDNIIKPSNMSTNEIIDVNSELSIPSCFVFENEFGGYLDYFAMETTNNEYRGILSMLGKDDRTGTNSYLVEDEQIGDYVSVKGDVLLAELSFNIGDNTKQDITTQSLRLKEATTSPQSGIKVNVDGTDSYEAKSLFEFTLEIDSDNAYLSNIQSEDFAIENFNKETFEYKVELSDYKDKINIIPTLEDENASMTYNEQVINNNEAFEVTLNPIGQDTTVQIKVTSEDKSVENTYTIIISNPMGTINGKVQLGENLRESMEASYGIKTKYIANISLYKAGEFNFDGIITSETTLDELDNLEKVASTTSDEEGNYTIYVKPGTYDCIMERPGFLPQVIKNITISEKEQIDLENKVLIEGDANRSGTIDLNDMIEIVNYSGLTSNDDGYNEKYDFGQKGFIGLEDLVSTTNNMYNTINIEEYKSNTQ